VRKGVKNFLAEHNFPRSWLLSYSVLKNQEKLSIVKYEEGLILTKNILVTLVSP